MMAEIENSTTFLTAGYDAWKAAALQYALDGWNGDCGGEIEYIKNYLKLMNIRFDYEIYLSLNIPDIYAQQSLKFVAPIVKANLPRNRVAEDTNIYIKGLIEAMTVSSRLRMRAEESEEEVASV